ncbi:hypothetical protein ACU8KH_03081 [Lachancea thermotolerans]
MATETSAGLQSLSSLAYANNVDPPNTKPRDTPLQGHMLTQLIT